MESTTFKNLHFRVKQRRFSELCISSQTLHPKGSTLFSPICMSPHVRGIQQPKLCHYYLQVLTLLVPECRYKWEMLQLSGSVLSFWWIMWAEIICSSFLHCCINRLRSNWNVSLWWMSSWPWALHHFSEKMPFLKMSLLPFNAITIEL